MNAENWEGLREAARANSVPVVQLIPVDQVEALKAELDLPPGSFAGLEKHPHYTDDLPPNLQERYSQAVRDPNLMSIREDIATINSLIANCLQRMNSGENADVWARLRKQAKAVASAKTEKEASAELTTLLRMVAKGNSFVELQKELLLLIKERTNLIEKETERLTKLQQYASRQSVLDLLRAVGDVIKQNVSDPEILKRIGHQIRNLRLS